MYENADSIGFEKFTADRIAQRFGGQVFKSDQFAHWDWLWMKNGEKVFLEMKQRNCPRDKYRDTPLDYSKVLFLAAQPIKAAFLVKWEDGYGIIDISKFYRIETFKRDAGNRPDDFERLSAFYLNAEFVSVGEYFKGVE